ncbi:MAG: hypothetical protein F6J89_19265, partial [Symploca sp. SIO1C4]|nr:hypothetical protein [Symploca sp. SIO1C4]
FPGNIQLEYRGGDSETLRSLVNYSESHDNWFAVCDPFAENISEIVNELGQADPLAIVGILIKKLPIWVYSYNSDLRVIENENSLRTYRSKIREIRCYRKNNTGYLIGKRLQGILSLGEDEITECGFEQEFDFDDEKQKNGSLILSSDIMRVVGQNRNLGKIIFNYPQKCQELTPYLFTAVLTKKSVIENNLDIVLTVLGGLRRAVEIITKGEVVEEKYIEKIQNYLRRSRNSYLLGINDLADQQRIIRKSLELAAIEDLYFKDEELDLNLVRSAYKNARSAWNNYGSKSLDEFPEIEECYDIIPSLLIRRRWRQTNGNLLAHEILSKLDDNSIIDDNLLKFFIEKLSDDAVTEKLISDWLSQKNEANRFVRILASNHGYISNKILGQLLTNRVTDILQLIRVMPLFIIITIMLDLGSLYCAYYYLMQDHSELYLKILTFVIFFIQTSLSIVQTRVRDIKSFLELYGGILGVFAINMAIVLSKP